MAKISNHIELTWNLGLHILGLLAGSRDIFLRGALLPLNHWETVLEGSNPVVSGKISVWNSL